jgi:beta-galactosidase GanA
MRHAILLFSVLTATLQNINVSAQQKSQEIPILEKHGTATRLLVKGKPFLMLAGELGNSSGSNIEYMSAIWPKLKLMHCNTALIPIYWELLEPAKGRFDFSLVDNLIDSARKHEIKIVFLWFGSWKNSMSCYVPAWIKKDYKTYPRSYDKNGVPQEILTPFNRNNLQADINAFRALMQRIKEKDEQQQTVVMIQVENENRYVTECQGLPSRCYQSVQQ